MNKIRCITIDDEPLALRQISDFVGQTDYLELVGKCASSLEAADFLNKNHVDLMFLDINMPGLNGLDFLKSLTTRPEVIFTTAYSEFAVEGFKVDALDYLLKPIGYNAFLKAAAKAKEYFELRRNQGQIQDGENHIFIKSEYKIVRINFDQIRYIEGMREYVRIYLDDARPVMSLMSMKSLVERLPSDRFMRVHRSFIVNLAKITTIERGRILFEKDVRIPVGDQYRENFQNYLDKFFL